VARAGEIVAFDVETTGLSPLRGHRVIEIGAVRMSSGRKQKIINKLPWLGPRKALCRVVAGYEMEKPWC
jgi:DNA polymerase III epsilon subunit-like protein